MSDNKKYYYLKLKENFFDNPESIALESLPDGMMYINILLKLYLRSLSRDGCLMLTDRIPYNTQILARVVRQPEGVLKEALKIFQELGLVEVLETGEIYMLDIQNYIGESSSEADRKRKYRNQIEQRKMGQMSVQMSVQMSGQKSTRDRDRDRDREKDIDIDKKDNTYNPFEDLQRTLGFLPTSYQAEQFLDLFNEVGEIFFHKALEKAAKQNARTFNYVEKVARGLAEGKDFDKAKDLEKEKEEKAAAEKKAAYEKWEAKHKRG